MNFSIEKKGYNVSEVDSFIEEMMAKYQRLQAQNSELEQKLATAKRLIRRFSDTENALKQNIADSKRAAAYMISDARDKSEELLESARESCGEIISDLDMQIAERINTIDNMKAEVAAFKEELFGLYSSHIELIDKLAFVAESFEYQPDYAPVADAVDKFEESAELPELEVEFVEYPEQSIFAELEEKETAEEIEEEARVVIEPEAEAVEAEIEEVAEAVIEAEAAPVPEFKNVTFIEEDPDPVDEEEDEEMDQIQLDQAEFDAVAEFDFDSFVIEGLDAEGGEEAEETAGITEGEEPDYLKFLSEFANSDEGSDL